MKIKLLLCAFLLLANSVSAYTSVLSSIIVSNPSNFSTSDSTKIVNMKVHFDGALPEKYLIKFLKTDDETHLYLVFKNTHFNYFTPDNDLLKWIDVFADTTDSYFDDVPYTILRIHLTQRVAIRSNWEGNVLNLYFSDKRHFSDYEKIYWTLPLAALTIGVLLFLIESIVLPKTQ